MATIPCPKRKGKKTTMFMILEVPMFNRIDPQGEDYVFPTSSLRHLQSIDVFFACCFWNYTAPVSLLEELTKTGWPRNTTLDYWPKRGSVSEASPASDKILSIRRPILLELSRDPYICSENDNIHNSCSSCLVQENITPSMP